MLRVRACGICGSDIHGFLGVTGRRTPPMTMGHEFSAEIAELGAGVSQFAVGDNVIVQPICFCGRCANCREGLTNMCLDKRFFGVLTQDGAMAEYLCVPEKLLYKLPESCAYEVGALAEPYAVAYGSVEKAGDLRDQIILIIGAGMIGLCILQLVRLKGPKYIIVSDVSDARLKTAKQLGADHVINPAKEDILSVLSELTDGRMVDISIEAVGIEATANQSVKSLKVGGKAVWVGMSQREMEINMQDVVCSARQIIGTFNYTHEEFGEVVKILNSGTLAAEELITEVISLEDAPAMFSAIHETPDNFIKVIIDPARK